MSEIKSEQKVLQCFSCGNETLMNIKGTFRHYIPFVADEPWHGYEGHQEFSLYACPVCNSPTLHSAFWYQGMIDPHGNEIEEESILYPINSIASKAMPDKIKNSFEAALKIKNIDNPTCFLALRRTLELILKDKGAKKYALDDKIKELAEEGVLPESLKEISTFTRQLGNDVAHDKGADPDIHLLNSLVDLVEYLIEYLYILPWKINKFAEKMNELQED